MLQVRSRHRSLRQILSGGVVCLLASLVGSDIAVAQREPDAERSFPTDVIVITPDAELRTERVTVGMASVGDRLRATQENGPWLWIRDRGGWIHQRHVRPLDEAVEYFTGVIRQTPTSEAYRHRGLAWLEIGQPEDAISDFNAAIERDRRNAAAFNNRGNAWERLGEWDRAFEDYDRAVRLLPTYASAYNNRGNMWRLRGDWQRALSDYTAAIQHNRQFALAYLNRGNVFAEQEQFERAQNDFSRALAIEPRFLPAYLQRGRLSMQLGDFEQAQQDFDAAIRLDSSSAEAYFTRGDFWSQSGHPRRAIEDYEAAIRHDPENPLPSNNLAWLLATSPDPEVRDGERAVRLAREAMDRVAPEWGYTRGHAADTLGAALAESGDFQSAVEWQQRAVAELPEAERAGAQSRLEQYRQGEPYRDLSLGTGTDADRR